MQLFWEENYLKMEEAKLSWGLHKTKSFYLCKTFAHYFQQDKFQSITSFPFKIVNLLELERIPDQTFASSKGFFIESAIMAQFGQNVPELNILDWKRFPYIRNWLLRPILYNGNLYAQKIESCSMVLVDGNRAVSSKLRTGRAVKTGFPPQLSWRHVQLAKCSIFIKKWAFRPGFALTCFEANLVSFSVNETAFYFADG